MKKIKDSINQDLATNKLGVFTALVINTLLLTSDYLNEFIFWICLILEVLIIFYILTMIYYKFKNNGREIH